jgi:hypothetical protein
MVPQTAIADVTTAGDVKQSWTDSNGKNCYPIATLINNCDIGEPLRENVVAAPLDHVHNFPFASSALYFTYSF